MRRSLIFAVLVCVASSALCERIAFAQDASAPPVQSAAPAQSASASPAPSPTPAAPGDSAYRALVENGVREFAAGNFQEALTSFEQAYAFRQGGRVLRGIAKVRFEMREYTASVAACDSALAATLDPLSPEQHADVEALRARGLAYTGTVTLRISPASARVLFDGRPVDASQRSAAFRADVGSHTVEISATDYATERRTVDVAGGGNSQLVVVALIPTGGSHALFYVSLIAGLASAGGIVGSAIWFLNRNDALATCQQADNRGGDCRNGVLLAAEHDEALWTLVGSSVLFALSATLFVVRFRALHQHETAAPPGSVACAAIAGGPYCSLQVRW